MKHSNAIKPCPRCDEKLKQAHPVMVSWFSWLKNDFPKAHVSWSFRGEVEQNDAFNRGLSKLKWPESKHNSLDEKGQPCSKALDLFELEDDGKANFVTKWYEEIYKATKAIDLPVAWGGNFKSFKDLDHFQLIEGH